MRGRNRHATCLRSSERSRCWTAGERAMNKAIVGLIVLAASAGQALAQDSFRHGRIRYLEPSVSLQRESETSSEEATANVPFLPGDRVWSDGSGRAEFQFPDGGVLRLDSKGKLDY